MAVSATTTPPLPADLSDVKQATPEIEKEILTSVMLHPKSILGQIVVEKWHD